MSDNRYSNKGGRPPKYSDPEELARECDAYFDYIEENQEPATIVGLSLFLGFGGKSSLYDYRDKKEFSNPIKRALSRIELKHEIGLYSKTPTGHIFALKNSGWKDRVDQNINISDAPIVGLDMRNSSDE